MGEDWRFVASLGIVWWSGFFIFLWSQFTHESLREHPGAFFEPPTISWVQGIGRFQEPDLRAEGWGHQSLLLTVNMCRHDISSPHLAVPHVGSPNAPQTSCHHMWLLLSILQKRVACFQMEVVWLNPRCGRLLLLSQHQMLPFQGGKGGPQTHFSPTELPVSGYFCYM